MTSLSHMSDDALDVLRGVMGRVGGSLAYIPCECVTKEPDCETCKGTFEMPTPGSLKAVAEAVQQRRLELHRDARRFSILATAFDLHEHPEEAKRAWGIRCNVSNKRIRLTPHERITPLIVKFFKETYDEGPREALKGVEGFDENFDLEDETQLRKAMEFMRDKLRDRSAEDERVAKTFDEVVAALNYTASLLKRIKREQRSEHRVVEEPVVKNEPARTKVAGRVCSQPHCDRDAVVWNAEGKRGWCRRHTPKRLRRRQ